MVETSFKVSLTEFLKNGSNLANRMRKEERREGGGKGRREKKRVISVSPTLH